MTNLTSGLFVLAQLKLNASVQLPGDQTVGYNHHHARDEEQNKQQQNIPAKERDPWHRAEQVGCESKVFSASLNTSERVLHSHAGGCPDGSKLLSESTAAHTPSY